MGRTSPVLKILELADQYRKKQTMVLPDRICEAHLANVGSARVCYFPDCSYWCNCSVLRKVDRVLWNQKI